MRTGLLRRASSEIAAAILLALAPLVLLGSLGPHTGHAVGETGTPVFADATHGEEAAHWEAASSVHLQSCPTCLASARTEGPAPLGLADQAVVVAGRAPGQEWLGRADPDSGRSGRPRAPPSS